MRFAIFGAGAVGGYFGARLAQAGHDVAFIARGAHLDALRKRGLTVRSPALGDFTVAARAEQDPARIGPVDLVILAVKAYDNASALPAIRPLLGPATAILPLQNGVDAPSELAALYGEEPVLGGTAYIAAALTAPGEVTQTGTHRRIVFGEVFGTLPRVSDRVARWREVLAAADIQADAAADGRVAIWEKFIFLVALAGFTGAARLPIGPLWADAAVRAQFLEAAREIERLARAEGVPVAADVVDRIDSYVAAIPGSMRSSLLIDLSQGRRIEVEALQGAVVRRAAALNLPVPVVQTLYTVLKPWADPAAVHEAVK
jgi:2-dehydropantoate 2-reductase